MCSTLRAAARSFDNPLIMSASQPIKLVTFDVVNTLLKVRASIGTVYTSSALKYGISASAGDLERSFYITMKDHVHRYPLYGLNHGFSPFTWWCLTVRETFKKAGFKDTPRDNLWQDLTEDIRMNFSAGRHWEILPGAIQVLDTLKARGFRLAVISNFDDLLEVTLENLNLHHYFCPIVTCVSAKSEKPEPRIFEVALSQVGVEPKEALHIGDSVHKDYFAARNVGWNAFLLADKAQDINVLRIPSQHIVTKLTEIPDAVLKV